MASLIGAQRPATDSPNAWGRGDLARRVLSQAAMDAVANHPNFGVAAVRAMDCWAPHAEDDRSMTRTLRDLGQYMSAVWAVQLHASSEGLNHASLSRLTGPLEVGSKARVHAILAYLQFIGLIRSLPRAGDGRIRAYEPTPALMRLFHARFGRELAVCAEVIPEVQAALDIWDQPGVVQAFVAAHGRILSASFEVHDPAQKNLDVFSTRNAGLIILGQVVVAGCPDGQLPPGGSVRLNLSEIARRSGVSRAHARSVLQAGEAEGFLVSRPDGTTLLPEPLARHVRDLMAAYFASLAWCAGEAVAAQTTSVRTAPGTEEPRGD